MLRITAKEQDSKLTLALEGSLAGPWVPELAKAWNQWQDRVQPRDTTLDLRMVSYVDEAGRQLLAELHGEGCALVGGGVYVGSLLDSIRRRRQGGAASLRWCWLAALGLAAAGAAAPEPPPRAFTLAQAVQTALAENADVHKSLLAIAQSQEDRRSAAAALRPTLEADAEATRTRFNMDTVTGNTTPGTPGVAGPYSYGAASFQGSMPLLDLSLWRRWKAAQQGERGAEARAREVREAVTALVVGQYLRAQRATAAVAAARSRVDLAQALEQLAEDQQKNGLGTRLDALRAQVQVKNENQRLIQAETQLKTARFGLVRVLNLDPATPVEVSDTLAEPALAPVTFQEAYAAGLSARPELATLEAQERAQELLKEAARDRRLPSVVASGSWGAAGMARQPWVNTYTVNLGVRVPLYTGGRIQAETARATEELARIREERRSLEAQVGQEVQTARAELDAARSEVDVAAQAEDLARQALEQARHRFEAGVSNNIEVVQAQDELARAADNRIEALYRLNQSRADLARAMGRLETLFAH